MNSVLQTFARKWLKDRLSLHGPEEQQLFIHMYGYGKPDVVTVVNEMDAAKLDWAMQQVLNTKPTMTIRPDAPAEALKAIEAMAVLRATMATDTPDERRDMVSVLSEGYCRYCWRELAQGERCHCENDE